jgi:hypothetical protein
MSWTYNPEDLTTDLNKFRRLLGDVNEDDQQYSDEEAEMFLGAAGSIEGAVARAAKALAARYSRNVDKWVGDLKILNSQRAKAYLELSKSLSGAASTYRVPSAGGIRISQKEEVEADTELVVPSFRRDHMDNVE